MDWESLLADWGERFEIRTFEAPPLQIVTSLFDELGLTSSDLLGLYACTNGISREWFRVLPIEVPHRIKETWDGLRRANNPASTKFLARDAEMFKRFIVFAEIGGLDCAAIERATGAIWCQEGDELFEIAGDLPGFIEQSLLDVTEL